MLESLQGYAIHIHLFLNLIACALIAVPIIIALIMLIAKKMNKKTVIGFVITLFAGLFIFYMMYYAGEYSKQKIGKDTASRLLNVTVEDINMDLFSIPEEYSDWEGFIGEYSFDLENSPVSGMVRIDECDEESYEYFSKPNRALLSTKCSDDDSTVLINARESDRNFEQIPLIQNYMCEVYIINNNRIIEIYFWERKNNPETIDKILDLILK